MSDILQNEKVIIAIVGLLGAIIGGVLTTYFAPWVKWKIEKSKEELNREPEDKDRKRKNIERWRNMLLDVWAQSEETGTSPEVILQTNRDYLDLEPHLSDGGRNAVHGSTRGIVVGSVMQGALITLRQEIARLEKEWDL